MTAADQPPEWLAELRQAEQDATPGPWWAAVGSGPKRRRQQVAVIGRADMRGEGEKGAIAVFAGMGGQRADDAELVVALRNNAAELIAAAEAVERVRVLADVIRKVQEADPDTGDRDVSFFALMDALDGPDA